MRMHLKEWRKLLRSLRKNFPVDGWVNVRRVRMARDCGVTRLNGVDYCIRINSRQPYQGQVDTLLHEWAHVVAIDRAFQHDRMWGELYSEIYESWRKDFATHLD